MSPRLPLRTPAICDAVPHAATINVSRRAFLAAVHAAAASEGANLTELSIEIAATSSAAAQLVELARSDRRPPA